MLIFVELNGKFNAVLKRKLHDRRWIDEQEFENKPTEQKEGF
jgi:hypothetical protein